MKVNVCYFASMRDQAGCEREQIDTQAGDARKLYEELRARHQFRHRASELAVAINDRFAEWTTPLGEGDNVSLLPPVSGG